MFRILKNVFFRNARKEYRMILLTILGFMVSVSLLTVIQMITVGRSSYAKSHGEVLNHGDLSVDFRFDSSVDMSSQQNARMQFLDYVGTLEQIDAAYESIYKNEGNFCYVNSNAYVSEAPILRFIDMRDIGFFTQEINNPLTADEAVLARNLTRRMPAEIGDDIYISPGSEVFPLRLHIAGIASDNEVYIQEAVENSYIFLDRSALFKHLQIMDETLEQKGYTKESYLLLLPTIFYVNGSQEVLTEIQDKAIQICESNGISRNAYTFHRPKDAAAQVKQIYGTIDMILSVFTILSFLLACCSVLYLVYIIVFNDIREINILKIYGLTSIKCTVLVFAEIWILLAAAILPGTVFGYFTMRFVVSETSLYGIVSMGMKEVLISVFQVVFIASASIAFITIPLIFFANKIKITEVLRQETTERLTKKQTCLLMVLMIVWILLIFSFITDFKITVIMLGAILGVTLMTLLLSLLVITCFLIIRFRGIPALSRKFMKKNQLKVSLLTVPVSLSVLCIFLVITCNYTLLNQADQTILASKGYNMQIMTTTEGAKLLEKHLDEMGEDTYFSKSDEACTITFLNQKESSVETSISYYDRVPGVADMQPLKEGAVVDWNVAVNANLQIGDTVEIETQGGMIKTIVSGIYRGEVRPDFRIAVLRDKKQSVMADRTLINYYLSLSPQEQEQLKGYVDANSNMIIVNAGKIIFGMAALFMNHKFLLNLLTCYFLLDVVIVVIYCTMILYRTRIPAFYIYKACGASKKVISRIVLFECIFMGMVISICGLIVSSVITFLVGKYCLPIGSDLPLLCFIAVLANGIMCLAAFVSLRALKLKDLSVADMLRGQE